MNIDKNSNGFSVLHVLLVLIVLGIISLAGWYVWNGRQKAENASSTTSDTAVKKLESTAPVTNTPAKVEKITIQASDGFSFEYPKSWNVVAYSADETFNGGQVAADDKSAIQWRLLSKDDTVNTMCVELRASTVNNAGVFVSDATESGRGNGTNKIWIGQQAGVSYSVLRSADSTDNFITLASDRALTAYATYNCAQKMTTAYSLAEQSKTQDYLDAVDILKSVKIDSNTNSSLQ